MGSRPATIPAPGLCLALLATFLLAGCGTVPETGRSQLLLVDRAQEARLGARSFDQKKAKTPISRNGTENARLQRVGKRISSVVNLPHAHWEFVLFEAPREPNAFALPGGKIGVYTGILPITKNDAGLATIIGHEVAHAVARHGAERMSQDIATQIGGAVLSAALGAGGYSSSSSRLAVQAYNLGTRVGVLLPYSRTQELEADRLGLIYMARAGYDPNEAVAFWRRFQAYNARRGGGGVEFLSTHPLDSNRIAALQRFLPRAEAEYQRARVRR